MTHLISASDPEIAGSTNVLAEDPARAAKGENGHFEPLGAQPVCVGRRVRRHRYEPALYA